MANKTSQKINLLRNKAKTLTADIQQLSEIDTLTEAAQDEFYEVQSENQRIKQQAEENAPLLAELSSLKTTLCQSTLKAYFPEREMSFHDKILFSIADMNAENQRLREALQNLLNANPRGVDKSITDAAKQLLAQTPGQVGGSESE